MNLLNPENQTQEAAEERALRELKDLVRSTDRRLDQLAVQTGEKEPPAFFAAYEEAVSIVLN
ncbi:MAG TPA: hypothetical protein VFR02_05935 [bacterium]|nr:hypothetical protein [bacterium]